MGTATMKPTTVRFDERLRSEATEVLDSIGLSLNAYLTLSLRQLVNQRRVPFELVAAPDVPNVETRRAMLLAEAKEAGLIEDNDPRFDNADDFIAWLEAE